MKKIILNSAIQLLFLFSLSCTSQTFNLLTYQEYVNIKIDGVTFLNINNTNADITQMNSIFNRTFGYEVIEIPDSYKRFSKDGLNITFLKSSQGTNQNYEIAEIEVISPDISVEIKGVLFKVGDTVSVLGSNFVTNSESGDIIIKINPNSNTFFTPEENYVLVELTNSIITKISLQGL
ncbi:hypothetical protein ACFQ1R_06755 [Mariniflexile jejuense]|uniref:IPT/TIG domain-containing protein n=1 Tax=Mariniflexile jejuense TaxID=1173582 RepID=A0ABW3JH91_9FLAO